MGFSLEQMIADLEGIIKMEAVPDRLIIATLAERLAWWKKYAEDCGQIEA